MKATFTLAALATLAASALAQQTPTASALDRTPTSLRLSMERIDLSPQERMGMLGLSYLFEVRPGLWLGPAVYGAVTGDRGGFFTGGFEGTWRQPLFSQLSLELGVYAGGGGGSTAMVGGGLMLRPHVDLMWQQGPYRAGISVSRVSFPSGNIRSTQAGLTLSMDGEFLHASTRSVGQTFTLHERTGVGFDRVMGVLGFYEPASGTLDKAGSPQGRLGYAGFRMEQDLNASTFWGIEAAGAGSGTQAGYAEFLGTAGLRKRLGDSPVTLGARAAVGLGGGGGVSAGGGPLVKAAAFAQAHFARDHSLMLEGGIAQSPDGDFRGHFVSVMYAWDMDRPLLKGSLSKIVLNEWEVSEQHYIDGARAGGTYRDLDTIGLRLNRYIWGDNFYLTGQAHSAYRGGAGGYSVGLFGAGARTSLNNAGTSLSGELLLGAAGGGGVASGGGAIVQPMVYLRQAINDTVGLKAGVGRVKSVKGGSLDSTVLDVSVSVSFGSAKKP